MLRKEQHVVDLANGGEDAMQLLEHQPYEVRILDWELPGAPGVAVCKQYRARGGKAHVLMLTGRADIDSKETGFEIGADDYLTKPYDFRELSARVRSLLRRPASLVAKVLTAGALSFESDNHTATIDEKSVQLTVREAFAAGVSSATRQPVVQREGSTMVLLYHCTIFARRPA